MPTPGGPLTFSGPALPSKFVGRQAQIRDIIGYLSSGANVSIYGDHFVGKTSLLHYIAQPALTEMWSPNLDETAIVYVNCHSIQPFTAQRFWKTVFSALSEDESTERIRQRAAQVSIVETGNELPRFFRDVAKTSGKILLLIDDFEVAIRTRDDEPMKLPDQIYSLNSQTLRSLLTVVVSHNPLWDLRINLEREGSPFYSYFVPAPLTPFDDGEVAEFFTRLGSMLSQRQHHICSILAGRHPRLLQLAVHVVLSTELQVRSNQVEMDATEQILQREFQKLAEGQLQQFWKASSPDEKKLLELYALHNLSGEISPNLGSEFPADVSKRYERQATKLAARGLLDGNRIFSPVFERYIREQLANTEAETSELLPWELIPQSEQQLFMNALQATKQAAKSGSSVHQQLFSANTLYVFDNSQIDHFEITSATQQELDTIFRSMLNELAEHEDHTATEKAEIEAKLLELRTTLQSGKPDLGKLQQIGEYLQTTAKWAVAVFSNPTVAQIVKVALDRWTGH